VFGDPEKGLALGGWVRGLNAACAQGERVVVVARGDAGTVYQVWKGRPGLGRHNGEK
jgi:hypothetical protein